MSKKQHIALALAMLGIVAMLLWVPYKATYKWEDSSPTTASAGYDWIFSKPRARICKVSIEDQIQGTFNEGYFDVTSCNIALDSGRLTLTLAAAAIGTAAILILLGLVSPRTRSTNQNREEKTLAQLAGQPTHDSNRNELIKELLRASPLLPISSGDTSEASPLVITAKNDYIPIEYMIIEIMHRKFDGLETQLDDQSIFERDDRYIDALTYLFKKAGDTEWSKKKTYYFDITAGMNERLRQRGKSWWQVWK